MFRARESYVPRARFSTWVYTITTNLCYDELRKGKRRSSLESMLGRTVLTEEQLCWIGQMHRGARSRPDLHVQQRELSDALREAITQLSSAHRDVVRMRIDEGRGYADIADRIGCSVGTAKSRMHYAVKGLREAMFRLL